jgi:SAM-dependent methyltransferase
MGGTIVKRQSERWDLARILALGIAIVVSLTAALPVAAQSPDTWRPSRGQPGKDVMWLPTSDELVAQLLGTARVGPNDLVYDLGAGDGKIAIAAARQYGARAVGIEYNPRLAEFARHNVERAGVTDRVSIRQGDLFQIDFSEATVVTLYLLEELNHQLRPTLLAMRPGTRVVSNSFAMGDWEPDRVIRVGTQTGYYWLVPARVAGEWLVEGLPGDQPSARLRLVQRYQRLAGTLEWRGRVQPLLSPALEGARLEFRFVDESDLMRTLQLELRADRLEGQMVPPYGMLENPVPPVRISARRAAM